MDTQETVEHRRIAEVSATATAVIAALAGDPTRQQALTIGYETHGIAFAAFTLVPEVRQLAAANLHDTFTAAHCATGQSRKEATGQLLSRIGWEEVLRARYDEIDVDGILRWDDRALREVLDEGYAFIQTFEGCFVFDLAAIRAELER